MRNQKTILSFPTVPSRYLQALSVDVQTFFLKTFEFLKYIFPEFKIVYREFISYCPHFQVFDRFSSFISNLKLKFEKMLASKVCKNNRPKNSPSISRYLYLLYKQYTEIAWKRIRHSWSMTEIDQLAVT